jgi:hypothetical protein
MKITALALLAVGTLAAVPVNAATVTVTITGQVVFNGIGTSPLGDVDAGDPMLLTFNVDSDVYDEGNPGDTRGYVIDPSSFALTLGSVTVGLADPIPDGRTPYFTLVDGFPVADGFFVSTSPFSPGGVPLEQDPYQLNVDLGYDGDTLSSLDILDAQGVYGFDGLTRFGLNLWAITQSNVVMEIDFESLRIEAAPVPLPAGFWLFGPAVAGLAALGRRARAPRRL